MSFPGPLCPSCGLTMLDTGYRATRDLRTANGHVSAFVDVMHVCTCGVQAWVARDFPGWGKHIVSYRDPFNLRVRHS